MSTVAGSPEHPYCFDCYKEVLQTELHIVGDDLIPTSVTQTTLEPFRWMQHIVHNCFQRDLVVGDRGEGAHEPVGDLGELARRVGRQFEQ